VGRSTHSGDCTNGRFRPTRRARPAAWRQRHDLTERPSWSAPARPGFPTEYHQTQAGRSCLALDAGERLGDDWRQQWNWLRLYSPARYGSFPGMPFPGYQRHLPARTRWPTTSGPIRGRCTLWEQGVQRSTLTNAVRVPSTRRSEAPSCPMSARHKAASNRRQSRRCDRSADWSR